MVEQVRRQGLTAAAIATGVSVRTARKWQRHHAQGDTALLDRSSRPHCSPQRSDASKVERALALWRTHRLTYERIAERVGLSRSTVGRLCQAAGLAKLEGVRNLV